MHPSVAQDWHIRGTGLSSALDASSEKRTLMPHNSVDAASGRCWGPSRGAFSGQTG